MSPETGPAGGDGPRAARPPEYYPAFLDLRSRRALVVGGGEVAARKVAGLLRAGAAVTVVAPAVAAELAALAQTERLTWTRREFAADDLTGAWLAIAATDERETNARVAAEARRRGVLVNVVDDAARGDLIAAAVLRRGDLVVAVSTGGRSPAVARFVRELLEELLPDELADVLDAVAQARAEARAAGRSLTPLEWQAMARQALRAARDDAATEARAARKE